MKGALGAGERRTEASARSALSSGRCALPLYPIEHRLTTAGPSYAHLETSVTFLTFECTPNVAEVSFVTQDLKGTVTHEGVGQPSTAGLSPIPSLPAFTPRMLAGMVIMKEFKRVANGSPAQAVLMGPLTVVISLLCSKTLPMRIPRQ